MMRILKWQNQSPCRTGLRSSRGISLNPTNQRQTSPRTRLPEKVLNLSLNRLAQQRSKTLLLYPTSSGNLPQHATQGVVTHLLWIRRNSGPVPRWRAKADYGGRPGGPQQLKGGSCRPRGARVLKSLSKWNLRRPLKLRDLNQVLS